MTAPATHQLQPGRVYRTQDLAQWSTNPSRLAKRLVAKGELVPLRARGLYASPEVSRFGQVPPRDEDTLKAFLKDTRFVVTGSGPWNALGLGATAVFATPLVYNEKRSGTFTLNGREFKLRRVRFPHDPSPEWFAVDLLEHAKQAGADRAAVVQALGRAVRAGRFSGEKLLAMAREYGTRATTTLLRKAVA